MLNNAFFRLFFNLLVSFFPDYMIHFSLSFSNQSLRIFLNIVDRIHLNLNTLLKLNTRNQDIHILHDFCIDSFFLIELLGFFLIEQLHFDAGPIDYSLEVFFNRYVIFLLICEILLLNEDFFIWVLFKPLNKVII